MEKLKKNMRKKIVALSCYNVILIALIALGVFHPTAGTTPSRLAFMSGFNVGIYTINQIGIIYMLAKYAKALSSEAKLKQHHIYETDERRLYIETKIGGIGVDLILIGLAIATLVSSFYNETVYFTILLALIGGAMIKGTLKTYYTRKV